MQKNFYYTFINRITTVFLAFFMVLLLTAVDAQAQKHYSPGMNFDGNTTGNDDFDKITSGWGIGLKLGYEKPAGSMALTFKGAPVISGFLFKSWTNVTLSGTLAYTAFKPKQDTFYYDLGHPSLAKLHWDNFKVLQLYAGLAYNIPVSDGVKVYGGFDIGGYITRYEYVAIDLTKTHQINRELQAYFAPKLGVSMLVTNQIEVGLEGKYNFFSPIGNAKDDPRVGVLYKSYSGNLVVSYSF